MFLEHGVRRSLRERVDVLLDQHVVGSASLRGKRIREAGGGSEYGRRRGTSWAFFAVDYDSDAEAGGDIIGSLTLSERLPLPLFLDDLSSSERTLLTLSKSRAPVCTSDSDRIEEKRWTGGESSDSGDRKKSLRCRDREVPFSTPPPLLPSPVDVPNASLLVTDSSELSPPLSRVPTPSQNSTSDRRKKVSVSSCESHSSASSSSTSSAFLFPLPAWAPLPLPSEPRPSPPSPLPPPPPSLLSRPLGSPPFPSRPEPPSP
ncbi:unnamed protein product, partial [Ectocarpus sp. 8 AP-2014]